VRELGQLQKEQEIPSVSIQFTYPNISLQSPTMQENQSSWVASSSSSMLSPCF